MHRHLTAAIAILAGFAVMGLGPPGAEAARYSIRELGTFGGPGPDRTSSFSAFVYDGWRTTLLGEGWA